MPDRKEVLRDGRVRVVYSAQEENSIANWVEREIRVTLDDPFREHPFYTVIKELGFTCNGCAKWTHLPLKEGETQGIVHAAFGRHVQDSFHQREPELQKIILATVPVLREPANAHLPKGRHRNPRAPYHRFK